MSVAEEVEDPGRNIPLVMILSVLGMMLVYVFVVLVIVGVTPVDSLAGNLRPRAAAAGQFLGPSDRTPRRTARPRSSNSPATSRATGVATSMPCCSRRSPTR